MWAVVGTVGGVGWCLLDLANTQSEYGGLVAALPGTPLDAIQRSDHLTDTAASGGHDGSQFYAIARDPLHPTNMSGVLDRPRYRLQRIFFPFVAGMLHRSGGGQGLVWTMFGVLAAGVLLGSVSTGVLATGLGGPPWPAALFGLMYGSIVSLRISTPDALGLGMALAAIALSLYRKPVLATGVAVATILTREPLLLTLAAFAFWRRDRQGVALVAIPALVAGAWWMILASVVPGPVGVSEFVVPMTGWRESLEFWWANLEGPLPLGFLSMVLGLTLGVLALVKTRPAHPLWWPIMAHTGALAFYSASVLAPERNASRLFLPIQILSIIALTTRRTSRDLLVAPQSTPARTRYEGSAN